MPEPELMNTILLYRDEDGWAASFDGGGTWDHATPSGALRVVGEAMDELHGSDITGDQE